MIIKYKEPWCLNPDIISYGMNKGRILSFNDSREYTFNIKFSLIEGAPKDDLSNIVWKGNDELGIQLFEDRENSQNILSFTFRNEDDQENKEKGVIKFFVNTPIDILDYDITISGLNGENIICVNGEIKHNFNSDLIFIDHSSYNFGGGHADNIEYDIKFLMLSKKYYAPDDLKIKLKNKFITDDVMGWYDFEKRTDQKVWDHSEYFNLLNRFYL